MADIFCAEYTDGVMLLEKAFKRAYGRYMPKDKESSDDEFSVGKGEKSATKRGNSKPKEVKEVTSFTGSCDQLKNNFPFLCVLSMLDSL